MEAAILDGLYGVSTDAIAEQIQELYNSGIISPQAIMAVISGTGDSAVIVNMAKELLKKNCPNVQVADQKIFEVIQKNWDCFADTNGSCFGDLPALMQKCVDELCAVSDTGNTNTGTTNNSDFLQKNWLWLAIGLGVVGLWYMNKKK